jgi:hypothetical protein
MSVRHRVYSQLAQDFSPNMVTLPNSHDPEILDSDREIHLGSGFHSMIQVTQTILISDWAQSQHEFRHWTNNRQWGELKGRCPCARLHLRLRLLKVKRSSCVVCLDIRTCRAGLAYWKSSGRMDDCRRTKIQPESCKPEPYGFLPTAKHKKVGWILSNNRCAIISECAGG